MMIKMCVNNTIHKYRINTDALVPSGAPSMTKSFGLHGDMIIVRGANTLVIDEQPDSETVGVYLQESDAGGTMKRGLGVSYMSKGHLSKLKGFLQEHGCPEIQ